MMGHFDKQYDLECIPNLYNMGVKGIILCSVNSGAEFENYLKLFNIPNVSVGNRVNDLPYVGIDDFSAMQEMTKKVLSHNPRQIIFFRLLSIIPTPAPKDKDTKVFLSAIGNAEYSVITNIEDIKECYKVKDASIVGFDHIKAIDK